MPQPNTSDTQTLKTWIIVPCAGSGSRSGLGQPKQYQSIAGCPLLEHTLQALLAVPGIEGILLVTAPDDAYSPGAAFARVQVARCGGATRAQTVLNGLAGLAELGAGPEDWVLVHDAARCLVRPFEVEALIQACRQDAVGGLLATPVVDTLKEAQRPSGQSGAGSTQTERVAGTLARADKWLAQTPQMFRHGLLARALAHAGGTATDEASAIEALGLHPILVPCSAQNIKVTYPQDFELAEAILLYRQTNQADKSKENP
jgi:2-C-methyl-D-erythritol 4-phosphate cytidylyltransferase